MRNFIHEKEFDEELSRLFRDPEEADDVLRSIQWALGRAENILGYPLIRQLPDRGSLMLYLSRRTKALPKVAVLFTSEPDGVHLVSIWGALPDDD